LCVKINGNRGAQQEIFVPTKVSKEIHPFQQEFPIEECNAKNDLIGHPELESDNKLTPTPSVVKNPTPTPPKNSDSLRPRLRLRLPNPGFKPS